MPTDVKEFIDPALHVYAADIKKGLAIEEDRLADLTRFFEELRQVQQVVSQLPLKLTHNVMVPFGKVAFFPGQIVHSNELLVHLGDKYYAKCTAAAALQILARRSAMLAQRVSQSKEQIRSYRSRLDQASQILSQELDDNVVDIRETWEESEQLLSTARNPASSTPAVGQPKLSDADFKDMISRLDELERLEAASEQREADAENESLPAEAPDSDDDEAWSAAFAPVQIKQHSIEARQAQHSPVLLESKPTLSVGTSLKLPSSSSLKQPLVQELPSQSSAGLQKGFLLGKSRSAAAAPYEQAAPATKLPQAPAAFTGHVVERTSVASGNAGTHDARTSSDAGQPRVSKFKQQRMALP